jgi:hypothetical protein
MPDMHAVQMSQLHYMPDMHAEHAVLQQYHCFTLGWHTPLLYIVALVTLPQAACSGKRVTR